jgi:FkbM family methyltransferase
MENQLYTIFSRRNYRLIHILIVISVFIIVYYFNRMTTIVTIFDFKPQQTVVSQTGKIIASQITGLSKELNIIDLHEDLKENFTCIKTKYLLHIVQTTICLHDNRDAVSNIIQRDKIWEERFLIELFGILIRYPQMSFIDAGANLGTYTMFAASFGRFVIAIECFKPNIARIRKAVQIEKVQDNVVLVGNAIFSDTGKYLQMKSDPFNVGSQAIIEGSNMNESNNDMYAVKTMRFDDILPILKARNIRNAVMKVDIQWAESFLCQTGNETFDYVNIPVVLMEWDRVPHYRDRMRIVLNFFTGRGYVATADMCKVLNQQDALNSWPGDIYWVKMNQSEIC